MSIFTVLGARPQFIKGKPVSEFLKGRMPEIIVHTGQHYDREMSAVFFEELGLPRPHYHLNVGSGSHGYQTGTMLMRIEEILLKDRPQAVVVYGDTNSTLAGALAASKLGLPVFHIEAGLRSYNRAMPEEQNRVLTDHLSTLLFCPTGQAVENLRQEGITAGVYLVGDVMYDALLANTALTRKRSQILEKLQLQRGEYLLATVHRQGNTDHPARLAAIFAALNKAPLPVVIPLHPRTRKKLAEHQVALGDNIRPLEPVGYLDMLALEAGAAKIATDSGGVQKEAYLLGIPCVTLRAETEWVETVEAGWNILVDADPQAIERALKEFTPPAERPALYGDGKAAQKIVSLIIDYLAQQR
jgi:UDP-GlcNAc3NAcA epimerase